MTEQVKTIRGAGGGGKGGGSARTAQEAPDSLRSKQMASFIDVISEGPIVGLVNGARSIYLNETPLQNLDGTFNFADVVLQERTGTQQQLPLDGFNAVESEIGVQTRVRYGAPVTRTVVDANCNAARVTVSVPRLTLQDKTNGDINGTSVELLIQVQTNGGGFVTMIYDTINGKTSSRYQRAYMLGLLGEGPWDIRVVRVTADSDSEALQSELWFDSYTAITYAKLSYPNSALIGMRIDSQQFNAIPVRAYGIRGMIVKVPTNYDPETREYTGVWDGTFKLAWTNNPAWCFYDMLINRRYGTGNYIAEESVDKWALYTIAQYCDQLVPDGYGGMEPRFTCNLYLQSREEAYSVIQNFASIFRAITFWGAGTVVTMQDRKETNIAAQYTNANVVDGMFEYAGTSIKQRHTVALVSWNDPTDFYRQKVEYVQDEEGIRALGVVKTEVVAFGCASRGQALRMGRWLLATERLATETVAFKAGLDSLTCYPGAIIQTSDVNRAGIRMGGRLLSSTPTTLNLDSEVEIKADQVYIAKVVLEDGTIAERAVANAAGRTDTLLLAAPLTVQPVQGAVWILSAVDLKPETWRVMAVADSEEENTVDIMAIAHIPELFDFVERGIEFAPQPTSNLQTIPPTPTDLQFLANRYQLGGDVYGLKGTLSWFGQANSYRVKWRRVNGIWVTRTVAEPTIDIDNLDADQYQFQVSAISLAGRESSPAELFTDAVPPPLPLPDITGLALDGLFNAKTVSFVWVATPGALTYETEVYRVAAGSPDQLVRRFNVGNVTRFVYTSDQMRADGGPWRNIKFKVRALGRFGATSAWAEIGAQNPQIGPLNGIELDGAIRSIFVKCRKPDDLDFAGVIVWAGLTPDFVADASSVVYDGPNTLIMFQTLGNGVAIVGGQDYYVRIAGYDDFGKDELAVSGTIKVRPLLNAPDANSISEEMIKAGALTITKFASGLQPVGIVDTLPDPVGYTGPIIVTNRADNQLYRWEAGAWLPGAVAHLGSGSVNEDSLGPALKGRIDKIDGPASLPGSVAQQIAAEAAARDGALSDLAEEVNYVAAQNDIAIAAVQVALKSQTTTAQAQTTARTALAAKFGEDIAAAISQEATVRANDISALAQVVTNLQSEVGSGVQAALQDLSQTMATADTALSERITTLSTTVDGNTASIDQHATSLDGLHARVEVKIDNNGAISGYALDSATDRYGETTSAFVVKVDSFQIVGTDTAATPVFSVYTKNGAKVIGMAGAMIQDGTITAAQIQAGAITATEIAANAITASKLFIGSPGAALNSDPSFSDAAAWYTNGNIALGAVSDGKVGNKVARSMYGTMGVITDSKLIDIDLTKLYRIRAWVRSASGVGHKVSLAVQARDSAGTVVPDGAAGYWYAVGAMNVVPGAAFVEVSSVLNSAQTKLFATNCKTMQAVAVLNVDGIAGYMEIQDFRIEEVLPGTLIQDGAISTAKLTAGAVTADKVAANAITADKVAANAITAGKIAADAVDATAIKAGAVVADKISVAKLASISADLGAITAGSLNINDKFIVAADGTTTIQSSKTGARTVLTNQLLSVYDGNGTLRVRLGIW